MLHFDFIQKNILTSSFDIGVEEKRSWNRTEEEHIEEYEEKKEYLEPLRY